MDLKLRQKLVAVLAFASVVVHAGSAFAASSYSIANAPSDVHPGDVFTVDVILDLDGNSSTGHEVSVSFTPDLLVADNAAELGVPPYQLNLSSGVGDIDNFAGIVAQFEAASLAGPIAPAAPFVVGQIVFQAGDVGEAMIIGFFDTGAAVLDGDNQPIDGVMFNSVIVNVVPVATPTATPTPAATPTPRPTPENECQCVPLRVVPSVNLAVLNKTKSNGYRSSKAIFRGNRSSKAKSLGHRSNQTREVGVVLKAQERTRGACRPVSSTDTFSLRLQMLDDDGDLILDETRTGLKCDRRVGQEKFMVTYEVENCAGSKAPRRRSKGEVTVTATTEDGELIASRILTCKK